MSRWIAGFIIGSSIVLAGSAYAQETPGPGKLEVAIIPAGATFYTKGDPHQSSFGNYDVGGAFGYNFTQVVGVEGEVGGSLGIKQRVSRPGGGSIDERTPNMLSYSGNVVFNKTGRAVVPYATVGLGGLAMYHRDTLGVDNTEAFLTGNVGGGIKWFKNDRWGLRGDYRFQAVRSKSAAPEFFGQHKRFGNRIYAAVIINAVR